ncbi:MAG: type II toxin-antitoxin system HicA family toxin [Trueperaceae bacterium]
MIEKLKGRPRDFAWKDVVALLEGLGYSEVKRGKTGGSRRRFVHDTAAMIILHEPHPGNELKAYQVELVLETLVEEGLI